MTIGAARATYDDVNLVLRLFELRRDQRLRERAGGLGPRSRRRRSTSSTLCARWQRAERIVPHGGHLLGHGRVVPDQRRRQSRAVLSERGRAAVRLGTGARVVPQLREANNNPLEYRNLEQAAGAFVQWWNKQAPGVDETFSKRIRG